MPNKLFASMKSFFSTAVWCIRLSWHSSKLYTLVRLMSKIVVPFFAIGISFLGKHILNLLAGVEVTSDIQLQLLYFLFGLLVITLLQTIIQKTDQYCQEMHNDILDSEISILMMDLSISVDLEYFDSPEYYDKLSSVNQDSRTIVNLLWNVLSCISAGISFIGVFAILCNANILYGLAMVAAAFPSSIAAVKYTKILYQLTQEQINGQRKMSYCQSVASDRYHAQDMRLFDAGELIKERYKRIWTELFTKKHNMTRKRVVWTGMLECLPEIVMALLGINIAFSVLSNKATIGDYSLYTGLLSQLWSAVYLLSSSFIEIYDNQLKIANIRSFEEYKNKILDTGKTHLRRIDNIEFEHVSFTYPGTTKRALDDISFILYRGKNVAFVGINGSGKSTLIKLLLRMYSPDIGIIRINGTAIQEYSLKDLRSCFSVYFQSMSNYWFSLRDNFTIADNTQQQEDNAILSAMSASSCSDILNKAKNNLDASLTRFFDPNGIELSGGQHQKLSLARTLFRRHNVLILDEPSSNLDPKSEHDIFESLRTLSSDEFIIFTSHRLSNVFLAKRIIVLEDGQIIEDGTKADLLRNKHRFAELFRYQQEKYIVDDELCE